MEQDWGGNRENTSFSEQVAGRDQLKVKRHIIIKRCFRTPTVTSPQQLELWHRNYQAASGSLKSRDAVIQETQSDQLDEDTIKTCIAELAEEVPVANGFCSDCQHLFNNWPDLGDLEVKDPGTGLNWVGSGADWKHTVAKECHTLVIEAAVRNGCKFCAFILQTIVDAELLGTFRRIEARLGYLNDRAMASLSLQNWGINTQQLLWINFPGKVSDHCNRGIALEMTFESAVLEPSVDTYDEPREVLDIANTWTKKCFEDHPDCNKETPGALPTRLVSIAGNVPQLVPTAGWETKPRYSTISHRWGNEDFIKLTEKNHDSFLKEIPLHELPKTFRDAIYISRRLGLDYIWIDSLCILQGNTEDWRREASLMGSVYGGSFVNIAAASAVNVHEGCFLKSPNLVDGLRASITVNGSKLVREFLSRHVYSMSTTKSHLATRAWAVQEMILSPRTIHFGNRGAFWECRTTTANEFLPDGFQRDLGGGLNDERSRQASFEGWWWNVVRLYSAAELTFSQDKLPALSGIVRRIHEERGGQYLAGMWREEDIEAQLCWRVMALQKRPPWRAPSWSWTAIDGEVLFQERQPGALDNMYAHVLDAETQPIGQDPFGEVRGGSLRIRCSGMLAARFSSANTVKIESEEPDVNEEGGYPVSLDCLDDEWEIGAGPVYLLPLFGGKTGSRLILHNNEDEPIVEFMICGILLRQESGLSGQFCRIGMFRFFKDQTHRSDERDVYDPFCKAFEQGAMSVAESVCAKVIDNAELTNERYVITLV
ncbi:HET-domain-containing protein [Plenodomus tracheiphilus IPT5]|uniref:HET-domain-containing protein n=1 Tax=Plenodomus tracheiphilus IPT5 TaxID=1408161 RepID=A0A6A7AUA5_9PLEO|nr:HET-domain-containing protein [Plenodomus tracheiphilus IPT5]